MIIGLTGYKGSGKTTACNIIKKHLDDVVQINFKDSLVEELKANFPDLLVAIMEQENDIRAYLKQQELCFEDLFTEKPPLIRTLMQNYGTNVRRADDPDYWVSKWWSNLMHQEDTKSGMILTQMRYENVLTDDVRFKNEAEAIKDLGGILIRLERTDLEQTDTHQSETEQKEIECDYTITCGVGGLDKLEAELIKILDSVE